MRPLQYANEIKGDIEYFMFKADKIFFFYVHFIQD